MLDLDTERGKERPMEIEIHAKPNLIELLKNEEVFAVKINRPEERTYFFEIQKIAFSQGITWKNSDFSLNIDNKALWLVFGNYHNDYSMRTDMLKCNDYPCYCYETDIALLTLSGAL